MVSWSVEEERYISAALAVARDELLEMRKNLPRKEPLGHEIVFSVLQKKVEIELREHVKVGHVGMKSAWLMSYVHAESDFEVALNELAADIDLQRRIEELAGDLQKTSLPSAYEISTAEAVDKAFRSCLVDKREKQIRDWGLLRALARGSLREVAKMADKSHQWVKNRKELQCSAIWGKVKHLMPPETLVARVWEEVAYSGGVEGSAGI